MTVQRSATVANRTRRTRSPIHWIAALLFTVVGTTSACASTLEGTIRNAAGVPMINLRVDLVGPTKRVTVTDQSGRFVFDAPGGSYRLMITYKGRRITTDINFPANGRFQKTFTLGN